MPNGNCLKCHKPILQGLTPHYCEECLAALGLKYDDVVQKRPDERTRANRVCNRGNSAQGQTGSLGKARCQQT